MSKKPIKPEKYVDKPYPLTEDTANKQREDREKAKMLAALERFKAEAEMNRQMRLQREKEASERGERGEH